MKITLHIERLVLDGLPVSRLQGPMVQSAIQSELAELLTKSGLSPELHSGGSIPAMRSRNIRMEKKNTQPQTLGRQIAGALHGKLGPPGNEK